MAINSSRTISLSDFMFFFLILRIACLGNPKIQNESDRCETKERLSYLTIGVNTMFLKSASEWSP